MPSLRQKIGEFFLGEERAKLQNAARLLYDAYLDGPFLRSPDQIVSDLKELDPSLLAGLINQISYEQIGGYVSAETDAERIRAVDESRRAERYDVITQWVLETWTNFGFGENVSITPNDEAAQAAWREFWDADRNDSILAADEIQNLSRLTLRDGEIFLVYFISTLDGEVTVRLVDTKEITEVVNAPGDTTPWYYKRVFVENGRTAELYYPDWRAYISGAIRSDALKSGARTADGERPGTLVLMQHVAHNKLSGQRGWPRMTAGISWSRAHRKFREDRMAVASTVAMYVNKLKVDGGQRAVDAMRSRIQSALSSTNYSDSNPPAAAGSTWVENRAAELSRLDLGTGASDAKTDGEALAWMSGLAGGLFPHYLGMGDAYRLATATSMETPLLRQFSRYQKFWSAQFRRMARVVLWAAETYGDQKFETTEVDVSTDRLVETDLPGLVQSLGSAFRDMVTPYVESGVMPTDAAQALLIEAWTLILQAVGVDDPADVISPESMGRTEEEDEEAHGLMESHQGHAVAQVCPLCGHDQALVYEGHGRTFVCAGCLKTYTATEAAHGAR